MIQIVRGYPAAVRRRYALAVEADLGVVTATVREFARVPGLAVEDWTAG